MVAALAVFVFGCFQILSCCFLGTIIEIFVSDDNSWIKDFNCKKFIWLEHTEYQNHRCRVGFWLAFAAKGGKSIIFDIVTGRAEGADSLHRQSLAIEYGKIAGCEWFSISIHSDYCEKSLFFHRFSRLSIRMPCYCKEWRNEWICSWYSTFLFWKSLHCVLMVFVRHSSPLN